MSRTPDFRKNRTLIDVIVEQGRPPKISEDGWWRVSITELYDAAGFIGSSLAVFQNSWNNVAGASNPPASWYLSEDGEVRFRGKISGGVANTLVFTLPEEVRPEYAETFIVPVDANGSIDLSGIKFRSFQNGDA